MDSGLTTYSVQYQICTVGVYGKGEWSQEEREAACKEFKRMTGVTITSRDEPQPNFLAVGGAVAISLVIGIVLGYLLCRYTSKRTKKTKIKK